MTMPMPHRFLVLLALLDGRVRRVDLVERGEPLNAHRLEVAVRHRMPDEATRSPASISELADRRVVWLLPHPVRVAQTATTGFVRAEHRRVGPISLKSAPAASTWDALCMTVLVREVGVGEHDLVDGVRADELGQLVLGADRDAVGVARARQRRRIDALVDAGDLRRRERDDLGARDRRGTRR